MRLPIKGADIHVCKFCGKEVKQNPGRKEKMFCDSSCRQRWWNSHLDMVKRKAISIYQVLPELIKLWGLNVQTQVESKKTSTERTGNDDPSVPA